MRVGAAVVENQFEDGVVAPRGFRPVIALRGAKVFDFADVELGLDRVDLRDGRHDGGRAHEAPDLRLGNAGDPVDRRRHARPTAVEPRLRERGARRFDRRRRLLLGRDVVVELLLGNDVLSDQLPVAFDVQPRLRERGHVPVEGSLRLVRDGLVVARVDREEEISSTDARSLPVLLLADVAFDLRPDVGVDEPVEREVLDVTLRRPAAAAVVTDQPPVAGDEPVKLPLVPLALDVVERWWLQHEQRLALAHRPVGDADAVGRGGVSDVRFHRRSIGRTQPAL